MKSNQIKSNAMADYYHEELGKCETGHDDISDLPKPRCALTELWDPDAKPGDCNGGFHCYWGGMREKDVHYHPDDKDKDEKIRRMRHMLAREDDANFASELSKLKVNLQRRPKCFLDWDKDTMLYISKDDYKALERVLTKWKFFIKFKNTFEYNLYFLRVPDGWKVHWIKLSEGEGYITDSDNYIRMRMSCPHDNKKYGRFRTHFRIPRKIKKDE